MANKATFGLSREFQCLFRGGTVSCLTDRQLLERFAERRDEVAFAGLVDRHGSMVRGVCRRVLSDPADAGTPFRPPFLFWSVAQVNSVRIDDFARPLALWGQHSRRASSSAPWCSADGSVSGRTRRCQRPRLVSTSPAPRCAS